MKLAAAAGLVAFTTLAWTGVVHAQEGKAATDPDAPKPAKAEADIMVRYPPSSVRWKMAIAGTALFGIGYGGMALMGGLWDQIPAQDLLFIPVAGPWIGIAQSGCALDDSEETIADENRSKPVGEQGDGDCEAMIGLRAALYIVGGLVQLGGLGVIAESIFMTTESEDAAPPKSAILPAPIITKDSIGFGVVGTF